MSGLSLGHFPSARAASLGLTEGRLSAILPQQTGY
jgi:hypothetical protein